MANYYPPVAFHFKVEVIGLKKTVDHDVRFSEVSGLTQEFASEEVPEGGENRFVQKYPTRVKYPDLVLKRGLLKGSGIREWIEDCINHQNITTHSVDVKLLNREHQPLMTWHLAQAYPTKWAIADLNATANAVVVESLQLFYQYFTVDEG
jgi:phage tail-like protein